MSDFSISRRQVLRGAGGFTLALPLLPSLLPRAFGDTTDAGPRRFVAVCSGHGGVTVSNMFPAGATLATKVNVVPGYDAWWGPLQPAISNGTASLSPVLSA